MLLKADSVYGLYGNIESQQETKKVQHGGRHWRVLKVYVY